MLKTNLRHIASVFLMIFITTSCGTYYFRQTYSDANTLLHQTSGELAKPYLKAHLKNGSIIILKDSWIIDSTNRWVAGNGTRYDFARKLVSEGDMMIPVDSVAIFETNKKLPADDNSRIASLTVLAGLEVILGIICVTTPKACYGSCPTFYLNDKSSFHYAEAEGFSNAIAPSMEYGDVDALRTTGPAGDFSLTMKNEALETHCISMLKLLACPVNNQERVYQSPRNQFFRCTDLILPAHSRAGNKDITCLVRQDDKQEYFSLSDEKNLCSKEEIIVEFTNTEDVRHPGLVLDFRQTLMTTYLIYNAMGYMGDQVSDVFAGIETNHQLNQGIKEGIRQSLGNIEVYSWNTDKLRWEYENSFYETGPIAINRQIVPLQHLALSGNSKLKLVLNKGYWRIDRVALTAITCPVQPLEIDPSAILRNGKKDDHALHMINNTGNHLISMPGDEFDIKYQLPDTPGSYELFLLSQGYYLEWMRTSWLKDKNLPKLRQMVKYPSRYLKTEAKAYKKYESQMEEIFWNSRIDTKTFTYHEN